VSRDDLATEVARLIHGERDGWDVEGPICEASVRRNKRADKANPDDFINFPYYIDVEPANAEVAGDCYMATVGALLQGLWALGYDAVAACDFEDELPRFGGYRSEERQKEREGLRAEGRQGRT